MKKRFWILLLCALAVCLPVGALAVPENDPVITTNLGNVILTQNADVMYYQVGSNTPQAYTGTFIFDGSDSSDATPYRLTVESGSHTVLLRNAKLLGNAPRASESPIVINSSAQLTLKWQGDVSILAPYCCIGILPSGSALTLDNGASTAKLSISRSAAGTPRVGIGNPDESCGKVHLKSGVVDIKGCTTAIGTWDDYSDIEISGGTLTAEGVVGSRNSNSFANVRISGGTVNVNGTIGNHNGHAAITISGDANVTATETNRPAIGTNAHDTTDPNTGVTTTTSVDITGGHVEATSTYTSQYKGNMGAGAGAAIGGPDEQSSVDVKISGQNTVVNADARKLDTAPSGLRLRGINGNILMSKMTVIYVFPNGIMYLSGYNGETPVNIAGGGMYDIRTGSFLDEVGTPFTISALTSGGDVQLASLPADAVERLMREMGLSAYAALGYGNVHTDTTATLTNVSFGLANQDIPASVGPPQFAIAHEMVNGQIERLNVIRTPLANDTTIFRTATAPTGASPFVLLLTNPAITPTPQTGDSAQPLWWLALTLLAGATLGAILLRQRRRAKSGG